MTHPPDPPAPSDATAGARPDPDPPALAASLEQTRRERARWLATASHELRQPLHALGLFVPALQARLASGTPAPEAMARIVQRMETVLAGMADQLDRLQDLARLEAGELEPRCSAVHAGAALQQAQAAARNVMPDVPLRIRGTRGWMHTDPDLLHRLLLALLVQAAPAGREAGLLITARMRGGLMELGVWIAREQTLKADDPGLGLVVAQALARRLGADLALRGERGHGPTCRITLAGSPAPPPCRALD